MTRAVVFAAICVAAARGASAQADSTTRHERTAQDTAPKLLAVFPAPFPPGPLPRGSRYTFTADSFALSDTRTLSDLLAHVPGVYVARGGLYGQAEAVLFGGRGPAALEVYWDGAPYVPLGRDSVYLDPARISLVPLERVDVIVLPATLRVYLVTRRQQSTAPVTEVGITTGQRSTSGYRGAFLKRWRSGVGLSLAADWNAITHLAGSSTTSFHDAELWLKAEYAPTSKFGVSAQIVSSDWNRDTSTSPLVEQHRSKRLDEMVRAFVAARRDGMGPRLDLTLATATVSRDSIVGERSLSQAALELSTAGPRAAAAVVARWQEQRSPLQVEARASWTPIHPITLSADARHATYALNRRGDRAHVAAGIMFPFGFSAHGDAVWARDLGAPARTSDTLQQATDLSGGLRWDRSRVTLEVGSARREAFSPVAGFATGLRSVTDLAPTPATNYLMVHSALRLLPGLTLSGWYFDPVRNGGDYEPRRHGRYELSFYSKFWRVYKSGIFVLRAEAAAESWSGGSMAGVSVDSTGAATDLVLSGTTFWDTNVQMQIAGLTIFWATRNARAFRGTYVPGVDYPRNYQSYGVLWRFTN